MSPFHFKRASARRFVTSSLFLLLLLCIDLTAHAAESVEISPTVTVTGGQLRGRGLGDGQGAVFKGIPFARPPVGELRWREPQPVQAWSGLREAAESGPPAAQGSFGWNAEFASASREDCLYLDVWTPALSKKERRPVMVWLHGGANLAGAGGADLLYDGRALIRRDVVLVVVEYRLGIFGFFAHPELTEESSHHSSGNYAFLDQIAALKWVHDNIAAFGGDPSQVTLFGQSAGAIDIMALMTSPLSRGLFHRAIAESGPLPPAQGRALSEIETTGQRVAEELHAPAQHALAYLRGLPAIKLLEMKSFQPAFGIDHWVFDANPAEALLRGKTQPVPLLVGSNAIELPFTGPPDAMARNIREIFPASSPKALALYGFANDVPSASPDPLYGDAATQWGSDLVRSLIIIEGESHQAAGNPVWEYQFDRAIPPRPRAEHSSELPYVFGNLYAKGGQGGNFQDADKRLSTTMQAYWTNFAKTGNPNGPGLPGWPQYEAKKRSYLEFTKTAEIMVRENQRGPFVDLFREQLQRDAAAAKAGDGK